MDIRTQIAPKGLEFKPSSFVASDKYSTIMTVISYPKIIESVCGLLFRLSLGSS